MRFMWLPIVESVRLYLRSLPEIAEAYEVDLIGNLPKGGGSSIEIDWEAERGAAETVNTTGAVAVHLLIKHRTDDTDIWRAFRDASSHQASHGRYGYLACISRAVPHPESHLAGDSAVARLHPGEPQNRGENIGDGR